MNRLSRNVLFFLITGFGLFFFDYPISLRAASNIPPIGQNTSCTAVVNPEFHSLRPYQGNTMCEVAANTATQAYYCGNQITVRETITQYYSGYGGSCSTAGTKAYCKYTNVAIPRHQIAIHVTDAELPIMGNTEEVKNSQSELMYPQSTEEIIDDKEKMNEYASWYLNGVINKAEYGDAKNTDYNVINLSGPIQKLYPDTLLNAQRIKTIENAINQDPETKRHNQIVACGTTGVWWLDWLKIGHLAPTECYEGDGSNANGTIFRLMSKGGSEGWNQNISWVSEILNWITDKLNGILNLPLTLLPPSVTKDLLKKWIDISTDRAFVWNKATPPLPWKDMNGEPFESELLYRKAYYEWHGKSCIIIPIINKLICFENIFVPNKYADFFPYVPLSTTEDVKGEIIVDNVSVSGGGDTIIENVKYGGNLSSELSLPHLAETNELGSLLQDTYTPFDQKGDKTGDPTEISSEVSCRDAEVRTNPGDTVYAKTDIVVYLSYNASYDCEFDLPTNPLEIPICTKDVYVTFTTKMKAPLLDDVWSRLVAGPMAIFKRMFPKTNVEGSVGQIIDIAGSTNITYSVGGGGNVSNSSSNTVMKYPHVGGVSEYFLKGIQTALRPKGYGETLLFNEFDPDVPAGECDGEVFKNYSPPSKTTDKAFMYFRSFILNKLTPELQAVYKEAERQTGVPCEVLAGIHFEEGSNNPTHSLQNGGPLTGSLLESAIQAGHELAAKVGGSISTWNDLITAVSYYNGGGNHNCGRAGTTYTGPCPPPPGIDDPYATSFIDALHLAMNLIYCADYTQCSLPYPEFLRPGVLTVATELYNTR